MLRLTELSNLYKRRTLRVLYGNTQAYPYAATLSANFDRTLGGQIAVTGSKAAINPGSVAVKLVGEIVTLARSTEEGLAATVTDVEGIANRAFGLFANFVGGQLDELGTRTEVGVWRGPGSVYEVLAPAYDDTAMLAAATGELGTTATEVYMNASANGRLVIDASATGTTAPLVTAHRAAARLISQLGATAIIVECLV